MAASADIWVTALSGALGALVGAGATVLGSYVNSKHEDKKAREERKHALEDRVESDATEMLAEALSLFHEVRYVSQAIKQPSPEQIAAILAAWSTVRPKLFTVGVTYPDENIARKALSAVGRLTDTLPRQGALHTASEADIKATYEIIMELLNLVRKNSGRGPLRDPGEASPAIEQSGR